MCLQEHAGVPSSISHRDPNLQLALSSKVSHDSASARKYKIRSERFAPLMGISTES